jgi:anti-anti-sigma factor
VTTAGVHAEETRPGRLLIRLDGEVDLANAASVGARLSAVITNRTHSVTIDLSRLDYLDSAGLRVLFTLVDRLQLLQIELDVLLALDSPARRAVELSGLGAVVAVRVS